MAMLKLSFSIVNLALALSHITNIAVRAAHTTAVLSNTVTLPIAKRFNFTGSGKMLQHDQARARNLRARAEARATGAVLPPSSEAVNVPIESDLITYVANVSATENDMIKTT